MRPPSETVKANPAQPARILGWWGASVPTLPNTWGPLRSRGHAYLPPAAAAASWETLVPFGVPQFPFFPQVQSSPLEALQAHRYSIPWLTRPVSTSACQRMSWCMPRHWISVSVAGMERSDPGPLIQDSFSFTNQKFYTVWETQAVAQDSLIQSIFINWLLYLKPLIWCTFMKLMYCVDNSAR